MEAYELITHGGASDFAQVIAACEASGPYCLIGGLAVNCYVEPVYTLDADIVLIAEYLPRLTQCSQLRVQFTTDERYQTFPSRSEVREVLGLRVKVACLEDVTRGKLWAHNHPQRRLSKRKKDELDLIRLAEAYPELSSIYPDNLLEQLRRT